MKKNAEKTNGMNKESLIASTAELSGLSKADSTRDLDAMIQSIQVSMRSEGVIFRDGLVKLCL